MERGADGREQGTDWGGECEADEWEYGVDGRECGADDEEREADGGNTGQT